MCSKVVAAYLSAFFAVVFPLLLDLFIVAGIYPNYREERLRSLVAAPFDCHLFSEAYVVNPVLYCFIFILLAGVFGGAIALISLSISRITKNLFSTITIPFIIYIFNQFFFILISIITLYFITVLILSCFFKASLLKATLAILISLLCLFSKNIVPKKILEVKYNMNFTNKYLLSIESIDSLKKKNSNYRLIPTTMLLPDNHYS